VHVLPLDSTTNTPAKMFAHKLRRLDHFLLQVAQHDKNRGSRHKSRVLLFANSRESVRKVYDHMKQSVRNTATSKGKNSVGNFGVAMLHGQLPQAARKDALADFKAGKSSMLITTDVAARGLDVEKLPFVVNFDMPRSIEMYVHRIGRTGRNGLVGVAETMFGRNVDQFLAKPLLRVLNNCGQQVPNELLELTKEKQTRKK